jgi:hypothetical protein
MAKSPRATTIATRFAIVMTGREDAGLTAAQVAKHLLENH